MLTTFYPPSHFGGDGVFIERLSEALARQGHIIDVIHNVDAYHFLGGRALAARESNNPRIHRLRSKHPFLSLLVTHQSGRPGLYATPIKRILQQRNFDVLHFHNISLLGGPGLLNYGRAIKLYTPHEYWLICPTHLLWKFDREPCTRKSCMACTLRSGRPPQLWRYSSFLSRTIENLDAILCPSRFVLDRHRQDGVQARLVHLPHFVPLPLDKAERDRNVVPYFLVVARLEKIKGVQTLLSVFRRYDQAELWVAGTGNYKRELQRLAAGNPRVKFLGFQAEEELRKLYRNALALIVPSLCYETFGMVILEAFAQQTPVIARRIGALTEIIEKSHGGVLYSHEAELPSLLNKMQADSARRECLGQRGRDALLTHWTEKQYLARYLALIESLKERKIDGSRSNRRF